MRAAWVHLVSAAALGLAGCSGDTFSSDTFLGQPIQSTTARDDDSLATRRAETGSILEIFGLNSTVGPNARRSDPLAGNVNRHLWLASLDTLSFLPITSTDPFTGVIATDWGGVTEAATERFRVTAFVTSAVLAPESLRVAVYREVKQRDGSWASAPVAAETPRQIEDSILLRARQLRVQEQQAAR